MTVLDTDVLKDALASVPAGVTIVTTRDAGGTPWGFTASTFCPVSLDPPLVLVCLADDAGCSDAFAGAEGFAVHVLGAHQEALARRFAEAGQPKFANMAVGIGATQHPRIPDVVAAFDCTVEHRFPGGDHTILVGRVAHVEHRPAAALVYVSRRFLSLQEERSA